MTWMRYLFDLASKSKPEVKVAFSALLISVVSALYTFFHDSEIRMEGYEKSAVDISIDYLKLRANFDDILESKYKVADSDLANAGISMRLLEYISYLSELGLIDRRFIAFQVKCDIKILVHEKAPAANTPNGKVKEIHDILDHIDSAHAFISREVPAPCARDTEWASPGAGLNTHN